MGKAIRIHLGCGDKYWPGWINVDSNGCAQVKSDVRALPFEDGYADEIQAIHLFEHLPRWEAEKILAEWKRVLKPGGVLVLELPSFTKIMQLSQSHSMPVQQLQNAIFGDPRYKDELMMHRWCWHEMELQREMEYAGFAGIVIEPPVFHVERRDFRIKGTKT